jgi:hypothetical protein
VTEHHQNGGVNVQRMTFTLPDVIKIVLVVAGAVALFFQVNGRLDSLDLQIASLRSEQVQLRVDVGVVKAQTDEKSAGRSRSGTRSSTD